MLGLEVDTFETGKVVVVELVAPLVSVTPATVTATPVPLVAVEARVNVVALLTALIVSPAGMPGPVTIIFGHKPVVLEQVTDVPLMVQLLSKMGVV